MVKIFLDFGANVDAKNQMGKTALHFAAEQRNFDIIKLLIVKGKADVNAKDIDGYTSLYIASGNEDINSMEYLLKNGAKIDEPNEDRETPLFFGMQS